MTLNDMFYCVLPRTSPGATHCQASNAIQPMYTHTRARKNNSLRISRLVCKVESGTYGTIINLDSFSVAVPPPASH